METNLSLFRRRNGVYYVVYEREGRRRWKSTGCTTKPEAHKALTKFAILLKPRLTTTLADFIPLVLEYAGSTLKPSTVEIYKRAFRHFSALTGDILLANLNAKHLDGFKVHRLETLSAVSANIELRALKAALSNAVRWKLILSNPFQNVKQVRVADQNPIFLSKSDLDKLLATIEEAWLKEMVLFAVSTGMRQGEIRNLRWSDVDLHGRMIQVQNTSSFSTKTGKGRPVPMNELVFNLLSSKIGKEPGEYVFSVRGRAVSKDHLTHRFKRAVRKAKLPEGVHFHSLRHTFASWLAQDGVSLYAIQRLLGHSSANVTQIYSHLQPDQMHDTVNRLAITMN